MKSETIAEYERLKAMTATATVSEKRRRGFAFEKVLVSVLEEEKLDPRIHIRPPGEEIDGSFVMGDRMLLLEAKWHADPIPASAVYAFKAKVDGKLVGTVGVFISMSGYSDDAVEALRIGKTLNIVLFDQSDFEAALKDGFRVVLMTKLRYAAEMGDVFFQYQAQQVYFGKDPDQPDQRFLRAGHEVPTETLALGTPNDVVVICEGRIDQIIIERLAARIVEVRRLDRAITVIATLGQRGIPLLANKLQEIAEVHSRIVLVADADVDKEATRRRLQDAMEEPVFAIIAVHPSISAWLFPGNADPEAEFRARRATGGDEIAKSLTDAVDIDSLALQDASFRAFLAAITA